MTTQAQFVAQSLEKMREKKLLPSKIDGVDISSLRPDLLFEEMKKRRATLEDLPDVQNIKLEIRALEAEIQRRMKV